MLRVLDLFSGIGGFSLGLRMAGGFETVQFVEIEPYCQKVLAKNFPGVPIHGDVRTFQGERGSADVICGGFPCQDISSAGHKVGISGKRSGLWSEYARIIGEVRPCYVLVENVSALLSRGLGDVLGDLAALGYDAEWHCIPASSLGAPHRRDRVWIVAHPNGYGEPRESVDAKASRMPPDVPDAELWLGPLGRHMAGIGRQRESIAWNGWDGEPEDRSDFLGMDDGIPGRMDRLRGLGNAVVPQVVAEIGKAIRAAI